MTQHNAYIDLLNVFDFHFSTDDVSFFDIWRTCSCISLHLGIYRLDFSCPFLHYRGLTKGQRQSGHAPFAWRNRDPTGS
jgi:hypothetical protein